MKVQYGFLFVLSLVAAPLVSQAGQITQNSRPENNPVFSELPGPKWEGQDEQENNGWHHRPDYVGRNITDPEHWRREWNRDFLPDHHGRDDRHDRGQYDFGGHPGTEPPVYSHNVDRDASVSVPDGGSTSVLLAGSLFALLGLAHTRAARVAARG